MAKTVSLIIPIYNEESHLSTFLKLIDEIDVGCPKELVFVDDCSSDGSFEILEGYSFQSKHQIHRQPMNRGKGAALRAGISHATSEIIGIQDADFEYDPGDIPSILEPLIAGRADVVYGSRFKKSGSQVHRTYHYLINRFLTVLSNLCSGLYLTDMETCYKFFRAEVIKNIDLHSDRFGFEPEVTAKLAKLRLKIEEIPISYFPRNYLEGKKITWKDGVAALGQIFYYNFLDRRQGENFKNMPEKYLSGVSWL